MIILRIIINYNIIYQRFGMAAAGVMTTRDPCKDFVTIKDSVIATRVIYNMRVSI